MSGVFDELLLVLHYIEPQIVEPVGEVFEHMFPYK